MTSFMIVDAEGQVWRAADSAWEILHSVLLAKHSKGREAQAALPSFVLTAKGERGASLIILSPLDPMPRSCN